MYLFAAGIYFTVIDDDEGQITPVLTVIGVAPTGTREVFLLLFHAVIRSLRFRRTAVDTRA